MVDWISKYSHYLKGNCVSGVDIVWNSEDDVEVNFVELTKKKGIVEITNKAEGSKSLDEVLDKLNKDFPVVLNIDGRGIVHKQAFKTNNDVNTDKLIGEMFPNYSSENFFVQETSGASDKSFFSLARKEFINNILEKFDAKQLLIYNLCFGPFLINQLESIIKPYNELFIKNYKLELTNGIIQQFSKYETTTISICKLEGQELNNTLLLAYSAAFSFYIDENLCVFSEISGLREEFIYKKAFKIGFTYLILFFFIVLLINFLVYDSFNKKLSLTLLELNQRKELVIQLSELRKEVLLKEGFFKNNKFLEVSKVSFYADRITCNLPASVILSEMRLFPPERNMNKKDFKFKSNIISISGVTRNTNDLNRWFKTLNDEEWVSRVDMINLNQTGTIKETNFELELELENK